MLTPPITVAYLKNTFSKLVKQGVVYLLAVFMVQVPSFFTSGQQVCGRVPLGNTFCQSEGPLL